MVSGCVDGEGQFVYDLGQTDARVGRPVDRTKSNDMVQQMQDWHANRCLAVAILPPVLSFRDHWKPALLYRAKAGAHWPRHLDFGEKSRLSVTQPSRHERRRCYDVTTIGGIPE